MMGAAKIMIVDDDSEIREIVRVLLESEGFVTLEATNGEMALSAFSDDVDLVVLDVMMAGMSGYQVCLQLRKISNVPILFLTAKNKDSDLTLGFSTGGDDYLAKPFSYAELLARVKGLLRRYQTYKGKSDLANETPLEWRGIVLYQDRNEAWKDGEELNLTDKEYQILKLMLSHRGRLFSAQNLYESIWEEPFFYSSSNTVMVHIRRLREKVEEDPQEPTLLKTVWGKGYRIE
ncbi:response regulator transcription factor [Sediminispirochaeta bajacaliforniensis]|uniref:response regulator transcription factor n=1 Tax=Sediminispirochaeta bajacaliforniensis TaxID=148 RepID=UPI0003749BEE|nr:response regulator transcription factor [Sediminispirochaeta bajacaliforniensis]